MSDAPPDTVTFTVDGNEVDAAPGTLVIQACEDAGVYIPRFCHHERMNPVGMCRMCIVEVDTGRGPALQPSCMLTVSDGMVVDTESDVTKKAQDGVLEFLLVNHPLDCPVCDKGGECPLQDQTMAYGPGESRFIEEKRHFEKPIPVNDIVYLDRERCILCDRCTRFADEVVGDPLIHFMDRGSQTQVNTFPDEPFASYFSGNTVQICPVGALTAKPYRFKARPWDLDEVESTYPNAMGDRISVQASRDQVLRFQGVDSDAVNWGWLSDKDRFSFEAFQSEARLTTPLVRGTGLNRADPDGDELVATSWSQALGTVADALAAAEPSRVAVIGGARLTNEAQYCWTKFAKGIIGTDNIDAQLGDDLPPHVLLGLPRATVADVCQPGGTIVLLGPDPKEELGSLYIRLRHAVREDGVKLIELTPTATGLSALAAARLHARPGEVGEVTRALVGSDKPTDAGGVDVPAIAAARALLQEGPVTVVLGRASLAETPDATLEAAAALLAIDGVRFLPAVRRGNMMGALDMGMSPGLLPGRTPLETGRSAFSASWPVVPEATGLDTNGILSAAAAGDIDVLILLGADPIVDAPDAELAAAALAATPTVVAVDLFPTASVATASVVLPASAFTENEGSHTNVEGRITAIHQKVTSPGTTRADWIIAAELAARLDADLGIESPADVWTELGPLSSVHGEVSTGAINADRDGVLITATGRVAFEPPAASVAIEPLDAYSLRLVAVRRMYDQGTVVQSSAHLAGFAGEAKLRVNPYEFNRLGVGGGAEVHVVSSSGAVDVPVVADDGIPRGVAVIDYNRAGADAVCVLIDPGASCIDVRLESRGWWMMNVLSGLDPLFLGDPPGWDLLWIMLIKVVGAFAALMVSVMLMIWWERKFISDMQNRIGPNRAGPFGILQTLADGIKLFFKEDLIPDESDRFVFKLAPYLSLVPAFLVFAVVPIAGDFSNGGDGTVTWFGNETFVQLADPHVGILFVLAMSSVAVYGIMLAGWSSGSKYPLLGSVRASAQMVSYEAALGLALVAVLMKTGSLSTHDIVSGQSADGPDVLGFSLPDWNVIVLGVVPFVIFFIATTAELNRPPFDLVEAEQELVGGFHTEYSSIRFALFFLAEFMNVITMSAVMVTLFFGGPAGPNPGVLPGALWGFIWFFVKLFAFLCVFIWMRGTLPRLRYDQLMDLGWKVLIPLALGWVLLLGTLDVFTDRGWTSLGERLAVTGVFLVALLALATLLMGAIRSGKQTRELEGEEVFG